VYCAPANRFVADFIGETNWIEAEVSAPSDSALRLRTAFGSFSAPPHANLAEGEPIWLGFRPEAVRIGPHTLNALQTTVVHVSYVGEIEQYVLALSPASSIKAIEQNPMQIRKPDTPLQVHIPPNNLIVMPRQIATDTTAQRRSASALPPDGLI
jgi:spermidine/putrescine transport system ATP-binding protein